MMHLRTGFLALGLLAACLPGLSTPNNPYGAHTFLQDIMAPPYINAQLNWTRTLTGPGGYVKQLFYPVSNGTTANPAWQLFIQGCYDRDLIPIIRIATEAVGGTWQKPVADGPGDYTTFANTVKNIVSALPKRDGWPLYIEVLNEPNNNFEWSGLSNPVEYGECLVDVASALRSLNDPRIKILNAGLSLGGSYNNLAYIEQMCLNVPGFLNSFDAWATHPYPDRPPEFNFHNGLAPVGSYPIDSYMSELDVLARYGRSAVQVIATEGGYTGGSEDSRADQMMRAFRDFYSQWPEVLAICPWELSNPIFPDEGSDWVYNDSTGVYPSHTHKIYDSVYKLAKPWMTTGTVSGVVRESQFSNPLPGVTITLQPGGLTQSTDSVGSYIFPDLTPGVYSVTASRPGYAEMTTSGLSVGASENAVAEFSLTAPASASIHGVIRDSLSGEPVVGATVITSPAGYSTTTGPDGGYLFTGLSPATYTLLSSKAGYYSFTTEPQTLDVNEVRMLDWWMGPGQPPPGTNLLVGQDFESRVGSGVPQHWSSRDGQNHPGIFSVDSTQRYNGISSVRLTVNGSQQDEMWEMTDYHSMVPGRRYRIEGWVKTQSPNGTVKLIGNFFGDDTTSVRGTFTCAPVLTTSTGWTRLVGYGTAPSFLPNTGGRLQIVLKASTVSGVVWADNFWAGEDTTGQSPVASPTSFLGLVNSTMKYANIWWQNSQSPTATGTTIVYRTDRYPLSPGDGAVLIDKPGAPGTAASTLHINLTYGVRYYYAAFSHAAGGANPGQPVFCTATLSDVTAPSPVSAVMDGGVYTTDLTSLSASWSSASDPESGVAEYRYRIGTSQGGAEVADWTSAGVQTSATRSGLNLTPGLTYYFTVQARNGEGLWSSSAFSDGIIAARQCSSIGEARLQADASTVQLSGVVATTSSAFSPSAIYIEQPDRSAGIQLQHAQPLSVAEGDRLTLAGRLGSVQGERVLSLIELSAQSAGQPLRPLGIRASVLDPGNLPDASGLLVSVWGRVVSRSPGSFAVSEASGIEILVDASRLEALPEAGTYAFVTGVVSAQPGVPGFDPIIRPRSSADVTILE